MTEVITLGHIRGPRVQQQMHFMRVNLHVAPWRIARLYPVLNKCQFSTTPTKAKSVHPSTPARTRFAPSPTGFLHLGSLRTALYNYLLAKNSGGQFILRIEDTDQKRTVAGAEESIFDALQWCGLEIDESPRHGGPYGPYRQSERKEIYHKYAQQLLDKGLAYKCFCPKERLLELRESAMKLKPPTNVTYDRKCFHAHQQQQEEKETNCGGDYVIRFKSPYNYPKFNDLLHGDVDIQPQYNARDQRFDDFVIVKADGMPTYHFSNVVDDHVMKITHVIRGEEWLASTPKHVALYNAFGWDHPEFVHIPLLTSLEDRKLSKRKGDFDILQLRKSGILPSALLNFVALFGWAPVRKLNEKTSEVLDLDALVKSFSLDHLTKGNAKVSESKLQFFQKEHFKKFTSTPANVEKLADGYFEEFQKYSNGKTMQYLKDLIVSLAPNMHQVSDIGRDHRYLFADVSYDSVKPPKNKKISRLILNSIVKNGFSLAQEQLLANGSGIQKKDVFTTIRSALSGGKPGLPINDLIKFLGEKESMRRVEKYLHTIEAR
ncbi:uncharacterized protein LODBEIA_P08410 [Lodderomyces beijingensis]|uniref:glutamate--tRNA ligase n=1 Tax=Lodderomyces beijingensis TaxID=1775926 RepID=A0ABP0ZKC9_9ASCO